MIIKSFKITGISVKVNGEENNLIRKIEEFGDIELPENSGEEDKQILFEHEKALELENANHIKDKIIDLKIENFFKKNI